MSRVTVGRAFAGTRAMPGPLSCVLGGLSDPEALHVYNALAQWADNERNGLEESDEPDPGREAAVSAVESVVSRLEAVIAGLAAGPLVVERERDTRPYHERRAEMPCCPECLSPDCYSLVCDEPGLASGDHEP